MHWPDISVHSTTTSFHASHACSGLLPARKCSAGKTVAHRALASGQGMPPIISRSHRPHGADWRTGQVAAQRIKSDLPNDFRLMREKPSDLVRLIGIWLDIYANRNYIPHQPAPPRGTFAHRHATWCGLRWAAAGVRWFPPDETLAAAGEIVWSWRRDPGATSARKQFRRLRGQERPLPRGATVL